MSCRLLETPPRWQAIIYLLWYFYTFQRSGTDSKSEPIILCHDPSPLQTLQYNDHGLLPLKTLQFNDHDLLPLKTLQYNDHDLLLLKTVQFNDHDLTPLQTIYNNDDDHIPLQTFQIPNRVPGYCTRKYVHVHKVFAK